VSFVEAFEGTPGRCQNEVDEQEKLVNVVVRFRDTDDEIQVPIHDLAELISGVSNQPPKVIFL